MFMVVADRIELPLTAYQTVFLPLKEATIIGAARGNRTRKPRILSPVRMPVPTPGVIGISARVRTGKKTCLRRLRIPFRHEDILVTLGGFEPSFST